MGCHNCRDYDQNSCTDIVPSNCVSWQGAAFDDLDICVGDTLTYINTIILNKILLLLKGRGIVFENSDLNLDDCEFLNDILDGDEVNLINILNTYKQGICQLKTSLTTLETEVHAFDIVSSYDLLCLDPDDPCGDPLDFHGLIQAIITKLCDLNTQFSSIADTILTIIEESVGNFLLAGAITSCGGNGITFSGAGPTAVVTFEALVPPNCPIIYTGSLANFDMSGVGLPNTAYCGYYLCNGSNGTPNSADLPQNVAEDIVYIIRFT